MWSCLGGQVSHWGIHGSQERLLCSLGFYKTKSLELVCNFDLHFAGKLPVSECLGSWEHFGQYNGKHFTQHFNHGHVTICQSAKKESWFVSEANLIRILQRSTPKFWVIFCNDKGNATQNCWVGKHCRINSSEIRDLKRFLEHNKLKLTNRNKRYSAIP